MRYLAVCYFLINSICLYSQDTEFQKVLSTVKVQEIKNHIFYLASDEMRGREVGSPEIEIAAKYLAKTLKGYGAQPVAGNNGYFQDIPMKRITPPKEVSFTLNDMKAAQTAVLEGQNISRSDEAVYLNYGSLSDFEGQDLKDKLVIVKAGSGENPDLRSAFFAGRNKRQLAQKHGAAALVEIIDLDDGSWGFIENFTSEDKISLDDSVKAPSFTHIWVKTPNQEFLNGLDHPRAELDIKGMGEERFISRNVVATLPGTDPDLSKEYMIYSAHYDHVGVAGEINEGDSIYNGARDNAVGVVTVLSAAQNLGKYPTKRSALFILFTAEEKGLLGSEYYVANPSLPLKQMVFCFNSDNGGYNDTSLATIIGLQRTSAADHIIKAAQQCGLRAADDPAPEQNLFDRSDNVHFAAAGIPAPTFSLGFTAFDAEIAKYYHQVTDNPETLDYDYLLKFFQSYVLSSRYIADDPLKPFWVEGDKYFKAGTELYTK